MISGDDESLLVAGNGANAAALAIAYIAIQNSGYLDWASYRSGAALPSGSTPVTDFKINVALILDRANDPTSLLEGNWASRQEQLAKLQEAGALWSTYGADAASYQNVLQELASLGIKTVDQISATNGYVASAESRTIWVQLDASNFTTLFGSTATLLHGVDQSGKPHVYWQGNLSLPDTIVAQGVKGLWFDSGQFGSVLPDPGTGTAAAMPQGWQSPGNSAGPGSITERFPNQIADDFYNFPLAGLDVATGTIGLVEPGVGTALPSGSTQTFQQLVDAYRAAAGIATGATIINVAPGGQEYPTVQPPAFNPAGERSLDVGVVTAINPNSALAFYAGSGTAADATHNTFTAYQSAFWDTVNDPHVITSSFGYQAQVNPGSPFGFAAEQLFIDAALRNISVFNDAGDGGSGDQFGNGLTNTGSGRASPFGVLVGGTSLSTVAAASADPSLQSVVTSALGGDAATIWQLVAGGLMSMPDANNGGAELIETVWNRYFLDGTTIANPAGTGFIHNNTGSGGVDPSRPTPDYQTAFGLTPTTSDPEHLVGRGVPDVSANAGGNLLYTVPGADMTKLQHDDGTSASTPLWAALASQVDAIFADQKLPHLGYMNDLLYIAAVIAPGSFNDPTVGTNTSSFVLGGDFTSDKQQITPTGFGYSAGPGYDLVTGLGTPNGTLLARALTQIAHQQSSFANEPDLMDAGPSGGWSSGAKQSVLIQSSAAANTDVLVSLGAEAFDFGSGVSSSYAWTARMAQQSLQADFDPDLVLMFDKQSQGTLRQADIGKGGDVAVWLDGHQAEASQATLSSSFGFADFAAGDAVVHLARAVAVAETVGGGNDQNAVVRMRQGGADSLALKFYRVDDYSGSIDGIAPGEAGYAAAANARAYQTTEGGTSIGGPGYGNYSQAILAHVDGGDIIAMQLTNLSSGHAYWAFAQANEKSGGEPVGHLWNYGANVWGWEDLFGGGDRDYNDLVVQLDFSSAFGNGWLV